MIKKSANQIPEILIKIKKLEEEVSTYNKYNLILDHKNIKKLCNEIIVND